MDLNELTRKLQKSETVEPPSAPGVSFRDSMPGMDHTRSFDSLRRIIGNESRTRPVLGSVFWQMISSSEFFRQFMKQMGVGDPLQEGGRLILSMHEDEDQMRYDLLVLSPRVDLKQSQSIPLTRVFRRAQATEKDLSKTSERWLDNRFHDLLSTDSLTTDTIKGQTMLLEAIRDNPYLIEELVAHQQFSVMLAPMPSTIPTNRVGSPAWGVALSKNDLAISTAGVATEDRQGRFGVTASLHGVVPDPNAIVKLWHDQGASCVLGKKIYVGGEEGVIREADLITDSCFIELEPTVVLNAKLVKGPLMNKSPYQKEPVNFDGLVAKKQSTFITHVDVGIPLVSPTDQVKVYTQPVTNRGDSGSALVNHDEYVVGFSHRRTGLGEAIEFAEWIWAHSVYAALQL